jgi:1,4-alpha-glucan branching enzyme
LWEGNEEENGDPPGEFDSVSARLGHLKKPGANAIQIMPVAQATARCSGLICGGYYSN